MSIRPSAARRLVAVLLSVGVVVLAACGDDESSTPGTSAPNTSHESTTTGEEAGDDQSANEVALPDSCGLLDQGEVEALIGPGVTKNEAGQTLDGLEFNQCVWEHDESGQLIGVVLTTTTTRYGSHVDNLPVEAVEGLGDEAVTMGGVSLETTGATGGRTISIADGGRTVVVALRLDGQTTLDAVRPLAESVLARLDG